MGDEPVAPDSGEWQQATQTQYDSDRDGELGTAVVYAVADAKDADPLDHAKLPVLHDLVDAEYLEETLLADGDATRPSDSRSHVSFEYANVMVTVENNGWITVYEQV